MCGCIADINAKLAPGGHELNTTISFSGPSRPVIPLLRKDTYRPESRRGKPTMMQAEFCPWCGTKYEVQ